MSEFRVWLQEKIARLDGTRERRFVALAAALLFAVLALGPNVLRAVDNTFSPPDLHVEDLGTAPLQNPLRFSAIAMNAEFTHVEFLVTPDGGTTMILAASRSDSTDSSKWHFAGFTGEPGRSYVLKARGFTGTSGSVESSNQVAFSMAGQTGGTNTELLHAAALEGAKIEASGRHSGFDAPTAAFRAKATSGPSFQGEFPAGLTSDGVWRAIFAVPGGARYDVTFVAFGSDGPRESPPLNIEVPAPEPAPAPSEPAAPPPPEPTISLFAPQAGAALASPVSLAARVSDAAASVVTFEILDPAGVTRSKPASRGEGGEWTAVFIGEAGEYAVGVRVTLEDGRNFPPKEFRSFRIEAAAADEPAPTPSPAPAVELFSPAEDAGPFDGGVPITARVLQGLPERVVAVVIGPGVSETVVVATKTQTGDFWTALFEGPDGEYRFRVRATVDGREVFSSERRFVIKRTVVKPPAPAPAPAPALPTVESEPTPAPKVPGTSEPEPAEPTAGETADIAQAREDAKEITGGSVRREELPASIAALLPVVLEAGAQLRIVAIKGGGEGASPALLILDQDGDGLPDDLERRLGADPARADTDGDGFGDGVEVKNGYSPVGSGALANPIRGVEKALLAGTPLEEPRGAAADPAFTIAAELGGSQSGGGPAIRFSGKAASNSVVTIFIYSYLPIVMTTTTDADGNWNYDFTSRLNDGRHEAYVAVNDDTGKLAAASSPLAFFVREAQAVSEADFLRPDVNVEETPEAFSRWFLYGGIALIAFALLLVVLIVRQVKAKS